MNDRPWHREDDLTRVAQVECLELVLHVSAAVLVHETAHKLDAGLDDFALADVGHAKHQTRLAVDVTNDSVLAEPQRLVAKRWAGKARVKQAYVCTKG